MMDRPKTGFGVPMKSWLTNELKEMTNEYLTATALKKHNLFNIEILKRLWSDMQNGKEENYLKIWHLLSFQMWYEKWMK